MSLRILRQLYSLACYSGAGIVHLAPAFGKMLSIMLRAPLPRLMRLITVPFVLSSLCTTAGSSMPHLATGREPAHSIRRGLHFTCHSRVMHLLSTVGLVGTYHGYQHHDSAYTSAFSYYISMQTARDGRPDFRPATSSGDSKDILFGEG
jgi:hypothetical protein